MLNINSPITVTMHGCSVYNTGLHDYNDPLASTNRLTALRNFILGPTSSAGSATTSGAHNTFWRGDASGEGGFFFYFRGGVKSLVASVSRYLFGLLPYPYATNQDPSNITNCAMFAKDAADTTWQFMHNDGSGTATKVNTTITIAAAKLLEGFIFCAANGSTIYWELRDLDTPSTQTGNVTTDLIANTQWVTPTVYSAMGSGSSESRLYVNAMYCESDW
jgi:hypothetical protein